MRPPRNVLQKLREWDLFYKLFLRMILLCKPPKFSKLKYFCLFIGYPRSGHTLIGALLDAHPEIIISIEADVLGLLEKGYSRKMILGYIVRKSKKFLLKMDGKWTKYSYKVAGQFQGKRGDIKVIGDKKGAKTTSRLISDNMLLNNFERMINLPLKMIHVVRNPFDNIATIILRAKEKGRICDENFFQSRIAYYFNNAAKNQELINQYHDQVLTIYHEEMIQSPKETLKKILDHFQLTAESKYYEACSKIVYTSPNFSRDKIIWPDHLKKLVNNQMHKYPYLNRYL
jgi:hypothetical protein